MIVIGLCGTPSFSEGSVTEYKMVMKKAGLLSFNGEDPIGWIRRVETYFKIQ